MKTNPCKIGSIALAVFLLGTLIAHAADMRIFSESQFGWSVDYPSDWKAETAVDNPNSSPGIIRRSLNFVAPTGEFVAVDVFIDPAQPDLITWFMENHLRVLSSTAVGNIGNTPNGRIAGLPALLVSDPDTSMGSFAHQVAVFHRDSEYYRIEYVARAGALSEEGFRLILQSFRFASIPASANLSGLPTLTEYREMLRIAPKVATCGGFTDPTGASYPTGNPFPCCANGGNCTWWARYRRPDLGWDMRHNAKDWWADAIQLGYPTGQVAVSGAVAVWQKTNDPWGHVAYIEYLNTSGLPLHLSEMNCDDTLPYLIPQREFNTDTNYLTNFSGFIYKKSQSVPTATPSRTPTGTRTITPTRTATSTPIPPRVDGIGIYLNGVFYLRAANSAGPADLTISYGGGAGQVPVVGDWNGDGVDTIGVYDTFAGVFYLRDSNTTGDANYSFTLGNPGDMPLAGRWDATMTHDGAGVYRGSNGILYLRKTLTTGFSDYYMILGNPGDQGVAGDWDGNGYDSVGVFRPGGTHIYLSNTNGNGVTFSNIDFIFGDATGKFFAGDFNGTGISHVGYFKDGIVYEKLTHTSSAAEQSFAFGPASSGIPIAGKWFAPTQPGYILAESGHAPDYISGEYSPAD